MRRADCDFARKAQGCRTTQSENGAKHRYVSILRLDKSATWQHCKLPAGNEALLHDQFERCGKTRRNGRDRAGQVVRRTRFVQWFDRKSVQNPQRGRCRKINGTSGCRRRFGPLYGESENAGIQNQQRFAGDCHGNPERIPAAGCGAADNGNGLFAGVVSRNPACLGDDQSCFAGNDRRSCGGCGGKDVETGVLRRLLPRTFQTRAASARPGAFQRGTVANSDGAFVRCRSGQIR